jgi:hypothetical protein
MRKKILILSFILLLVIGSVLNISVTTKQGINYNVSEIKLPLYLKVLNFFYRHFNYKWLVNRITKDLETKEDKVFRLFQWTHETIHFRPKNLPIMDDHVWNVYVRGYGVSDNFHDLFTTLCHYIGVDAVYLKITNKDSGKILDLSVVQLKKGWVIFDPYKGVYFLNKSGGLSTVEEIKNQNWKLAKLGLEEVPDSYYKSHLNALPDVEKIALGRASIQSPINRLKWEFNQWASDTD